jgi:hypothetical protein
LSLIARLHGDAIQLRHVSCAKRGVRLGAGSHTSRDVRTSSIFAAGSRERFRGTGRVRDATATAGAISAPWTRGCNFSVAYRACCATIQYTYTHSRDLSVSSGARATQHCFAYISLNLLAWSPSAASKICKRLPLLQARRKRSQSHP